MNETGGRKRPSHFPVRSLFSDTRYAVRSFRQRPGFTVTAVAALALGTGATTAIFSLVNAVLLKPLPVFDADRFVLLTTTDDGGSDAVSPAKFIHWRAQTSVFRDVSAFSMGAMNYTGGNVVELWPSMQASADTFRCWGIPILLGRSFTPEEDLPSGPRVVLIGRTLWKRRFAGDPNVVGKTVLLSGEPFTIVGVAGESAGLREVGPPPEVYEPFRIDPLTRDLGNYFQVVARLQPGVTVEQANARLRVSAADYRARFAKDLGPKERFVVRPFREALVGEIRPLLFALFGAVTLVLLIACANVANLLLVRAAGRRREIAIRAALGAGRGRMIRQLLAESGLLSLAGGALGLLLGYGGIRALLSVNTADLPMLGESGSAVGLDWRVLAFALAVSLVTGIVFGLFPALQGSRADLNSILKDSSGRTGTGLRQNKARAALVLSEVSLAVVLLVGAALLIRTFGALYAVERGFDTKNVITLRSLLAGPKYAKARDTAEAIRSGLEHIRSVPGVVAASATCCLPLQGSYDLNFEIMGRNAMIGGSTPQAGWTMISPGFFEVFGIPLKRGRTFTGHDDGGSPAVVVINERMAKMFWKNGDPLQDRIAIGRGLMKEFRDEPVRQVIGIVGDTRDDGLNNNPRPIMYIPQAQLPDAANAWFIRSPLAWVARTRIDPHALASPIAEQLKRAVGLPVSEVRSMDQVVALSIGRQRFNMLLMTVFGCSSLLLAAIGIYGLLAYTVEQRTQEIGIRLALGADARGVRNMVVREGMSLVLAGVATGLLAAGAMGQVIDSFLFGVQARDPAVFVVVPAILSAVALAAIWLPANRASRLNPLDSLRHD
ncbi:MAG: ABC transporter permease [Acidobacteriota bacterium]